MSRSRDIQGFVAWCDEFVHQVMDHNGTVMSTEFAEQVNLLRRAARVEDIDIPPIKDEETLYSVLDEFRYRLGPILRAEDSLLAKEIDDQLKRLLAPHVWRY